MLRLHVVGEGTNELRRAAADMRVSDLVETARPTAHDEITRLQQNAQALLVLSRSSTINGYELFAPAKVFEYVKAMRPILGVVADDETRKVLTRVGVSSIADANSPTAICSVLRRLVDGWSKRDLASFLPDPGKCVVFSAERQTDALVRALEGAAPMEPFVPDSVECPASIRRALLKQERRR
jgi:hypothetical protein